MSDDDKHELSEEDVALWREVTRADKKLPGKKIETPSVAKEPPEDEGVLEEEGVPASEEAAPDVAVAKTYVPLTLGDTKGMDRRLAERFVRGKLPIEARLDLHGMTRDEALPTLQHFVDVQYAARKRVLLVITGKGTRSETGQGVLQQEMPHWVNLPSLRPMILSFTFAKAKDGGTGAYYLLLKRQR